MTKKTVLKHEASDDVKKPLIAKKDFAIHHNEYHREIHQGDDLSDVPEVYLTNLKTELVI